MLPLKNKGDPTEIPLGYPRELWVAQMMMGAPCAAAMGSARLPMVMPLDCFGLRTCPTTIQVEVVVVVAPC